jgi:hypothetical protein
MLACAREIPTVVRQPCPVYLFSQTVVSDSAPAPWLQTSGICLGGCHGTTPEGPIRPMTPREELILDAVATLATLPFGGEFVTLARGGFAARGAVATAKELNKIAHAFPRAGKGVEALVRASGGSELNALRAMQTAANQALVEGRIVAGANGILPGNGLGAILNVNGVNVQLIGGRVIDGVVELGSFVGL